MSQQIRVFKNDEVEIGLITADEVDKRLQVDNLFLRVAATVATFKLHDGFAVPVAFIGDGGSRFKTSTELKALANELAVAVAAVADEQSKELKRIALHEFEEAKEGLRRALRSFRIEISQDVHVDQTFFKARAIAGAALTVVARFDADWFLDGQKSEGTALFEVSGSAGLAVIVGGKTTVASITLSATVTAQAGIKLLPSFDLPQTTFPGLPKLDLGWSGPFDFGALDLSGFSLPSFDKFARFAIPAISALNQSPFELVWRTGTPKLTFAVDATGNLLITSGAPASGDLMLKTGAPQKVADLNDFAFTLDNANLSLKGIVILNAAAAPKPIALDFDSPAFPLAVHSLDAAANVKISMSGEYDLATGKIVKPILIASELSWPKLQIVSRSDPRTFLTLDVGYQATSNVADGGISGRLSRLRIVEPYPIDLICATGEAAIDGVVRLLCALDISVKDPGFGSLIKRLDEFAAEIGRWLADRAASIGASLVDAGEFLFSGAGKIFEALHGMLSAASKYVVVEVRLDASNWAIRQIRVGLEGVDGQPMKLEAPGLTLSIPGGWRPSLLVDLSESRPLFALTACPLSLTDSVSLSTDLWLSRPNAPTEPVRDSKATEGTRPDSPLIEIKATLNPSIKAVALVALEDGEVSFFLTMEDPPLEEALTLDGGAITFGTFNGRPVLRNPTIGDAAPADIVLAVTVAKDAEERLLPFLSAPDPSNGAPQGGGLIDSLGQYIKVGDGGPTVGVADGKVKLDLPIVVGLGSLKVKSSIRFAIDIRTLQATIGGDNTVAIDGPEVRSAQLLGLDAAILPVKKLSKPDENFRQFTLDFSHGGVRLALAKDTARLELSYRRIASGGRGLVFKIDDFAVGKGGIDLEAKADPDIPVNLAGIEVPFRFTEGGVSIKSSRLNSFNITGKGQLPPALIGEANLTASLAMGMRDGNLSFQSASVVMDKGADPIVSQTIRFALSLQKVELDAWDFGTDGIHFWFLVTGSARFSPGSGEFTDGLLKNLSDLEIVFDKAPLTTNVSVLKRRLRDFKIAVRMKKQINFFNLFKFELRSFGFHPEVARFANKPAVSISGQLNFADMGDAVSPKIDFHDLWIAPPKPGTSLPQIAFDGLGVEMKLGGAKVEATAVTVDGMLPTLALDPAVHYPDGITMEGFLASGRVIVDGWAPIAGAMGFLEIGKADGSRKHSFFVYGQAEQLSVPIPTPVCNLYLREVGFGLGFRYTFAGLVAADQVKSPEELIQVLDEVSKRQGDLASFKAWAPEIEGDRLTLAMRALFTTQSATEKNELTEEERYIANPFLFDIAAALRSDLTFLMTVRAWLNTNYYTWVNGKLDDSNKVITTKENVRSSPPLRGYLYLSAPRRTFLGRLIADGSGYLGEDPPLNPVLKAAMQGVRWSATMLIQPGLFHFEMGWPYELEIKFEDKTAISEMAITMQGGMVFRIEDTSMLYGVAFRGFGYAQIGGKIGNDSFGASAVARADFQIDGKFIAYIPVGDPKNTLFYGAISFATTLSIRIDVWLRIKIFGGSISFSVHLSFSQTLTLALELAASPTALGGRGAASLSFSAFGRTARVGAAFAFNEGKLEEARQQVERFLTIGLGVVTPDPANGLQPPAPTASPKQASKDIDTAIDRRHDLVKALETIPAAVIDQPSFWAVLFEIPASRRVDPDRRDFVMQFIPRDHTEGVNLPNEKPGSTFYAPPAPSLDGDPTQPTSNTVVDYRIDDKTISLINLKPDGREVTARQFNADQDATLAVVAATKDSTGGRFKLYHLLHECFLAVDKDGDKYIRRADDKLFEGDLFEPPEIEIDAIPKRLPDDNAQATEALRDAGRRQLPLANATPQKGVPTVSDYVREVEERRSNIIAAIAESAASLADSVIVEKRNDNSLAYRWPDRKIGVDARDIGLTFLVTHQDVINLFTNEGKDLPPKSKFTISARTDKKAEAPTAAGKPARLLNPLDRFFSAQNPTLADASARLTKDGIALDWDLEPPWSKSSGPYNDPEFLARYYLVRREVIGKNGTDPRYPAIEFKVKASAPERRVLDKDKDKDNDKIKFRIERLRHTAHLVDTLDDFAVIGKGGTNVADAILRRGGDPLGIWSKIKEEDRPRRLLYTVTPVDLAGSRAQPTPIVFDVTEPGPASKPLAKAEVIFRYSKMLTQATLSTGDLELFLRIDDPIIRKTKDEASLPPNGSLYKIRFRREIAVPGGSFGVDSLIQARTRPSPDDFGHALRPEDYDIIVSLKAGDTVLQDDPTGVGRPFTAAERFQPLQIASSPPGWNPIRGDAYFHVQSGNLDDLKRLLTGASTDLVGYRAAVQRIDVPTSLVEGSTAKISSPWCPADLALLVHNDQTKKSMDALPVETMVEVFEHPRNLTFNALDFEDLDGEAGRLDIFHPLPDKSLTDLVNAIDPANRPKDKAAPPVSPIRRLVDPARRTATRVRWNSRPVSSSAHLGSVSPTLYHRLIGGFDVFETDLSELARLRDLPDYARPIARVQRLPDDQLGLDPSEIVDFEKVEAHYPSEAHQFLATDQRGGGGARAPWFSTADTLLQWPRLMLRRFVLSTPPDADLMPLFEPGRPSIIRVRMTLPEVELDDGRKFSGKVKLVSADVKSKQSPEDPRYWTFEKEGGWRPSELSELLRNLCWKPVDGEDASSADEAYRQKPSLFSAVEFSVGAGSWGSLPEVAFKASLDSHLHPFLADVIDRLRFDASSGTLYRRYSPVLDGAPPTKAKSLAELMNERPPGRDPYGWALLRTLGLATGIKLFDLERTDYVPAKDALPLINLAFKQVAKVYLTPAMIGSLGQPFVEIMASADGLHALSSFDSSVPAATAQDAGDLIADKGLSLVQIALRPATEGLMSALFVGYVVVRCTGKDSSAKTIPSPVLGAGFAGALLECIDISGGLSGGRPVLVGVGDPAVIAAMSPGPTLPQTFDVANAVKGPAALIRVTVAGTGDAASLITEWQAATVKHPHFNVEAVPRPSSIPGVEAPAGDADIFPEPFERFGPLSGAALNVLMYGTDQAPRRPEALDAILGLLKHAERKGFKDEEIDVKKPGGQDRRAARLAELHAFTARFIAHGSATLIKKDDTSFAVPFALATVTRHTPWRIAPTPDGVVDMLLVHDDNWARRRRYVVRPFGRYENLANAVAAGAIVPGDDATELANSIIPPNLRDIAAGAETFADRSIDITVPRTHPVLAPTFLSAQRLDVIDLSDADVGDLQREGPAVVDAAKQARWQAGRQIEFVLARHPEEIVSEGNRQVADGYQFDGLGLQFFREYASPGWARGLHDNGAIWIGEDRDLVPALGQPARPAPLPISFGSSSFTESRLSETGGAMGAYHGTLPQRIVDGWRGILALRTADIPYFYRTLAVAHVSAGVVVSDAAAALVSEGRAIPRLPWAHAPWESEGAPRSVATRKPYWSVRLDKTGTLITIVVSLPLLRHIDALSSEEHAQWLTGIDLPRVFRLPDANALYSVALEAGSAIGGSRAVEADLMPLPPDASAKPPREASSYIVSAAGSHFKPAPSQFVDALDKPARVVPAWEKAAIPAPTSSDGEGVWKVDMSLVRQYIAPKEDKPADPVELGLSPLARSALATFEVAAAPHPASGWQLWTGISKPVTTTFVVTRPKGTKPADWIGFRDGVLALHDQYLQLVPGSASLSFLQRMLACASDPNPDAAWKKFAGAKTSYSETIANWVPGLPRQVGTSADVIVVMAPPPDASQWGARVDESQSGVYKRVDIADLILSAVGASPEAKQALVNSLWGTMSGLVVARLKRQSLPAHGYGSLSRPIEASAFEKIAGAVDDPDLPRVFEMTREYDLGVFESSPAAFAKLCTLIDTIETTPTLKNDGLDPREGFERSFLALDRLAMKRGSSDGTILMMGQNALDHYEGLLKDYLTAVTEPVVLVPGKPKTLTLRRPPADVELSKLLGLSGIDDTTVGALRHLSQDLTLGVGRRMTVRISRGFAIPVSDAIERFPS
ncbi:hypothetical protein [Rhizobium leguminosarum]